MVAASEDETPHWRVEAEAAASRHAPFAELETPETTYVMGLDLESSAPTPNLLPEVAWHLDQSQH